MSSASDTKLLIEIGRVLHEARINQGLSMEDMYKKLGMRADRKLPQTVNNMKIETSISLEMRDEEVEIYGKPNCWDIGRG